MPNEEPKAVGNRVLVLGFMEGAGAKVAAGSHFFFATIIREGRLTILLSACRFCAACGKATRQSSHDTEDSHKIHLAPRWPPE